MECILIDMELAQFICFSGGVTIKFLNHPDSALALSQSFFCSLHPIDNVVLHRINSSPMRFSRQKIAASFLVLFSLLSGSASAFADESISVLKLEKPKEIESPRKVQMT